MTNDDLLKDIRGDHEYDTRRWEPIKREAKTDMKFVGGDPWDADDKIQRGKRVTVAPEEMGQYFNQVINALKANPRGMSFVARGNGAYDEGARWYENKFREIEYRSKASQKYLLAAENAIQRSYGFSRVSLRYASPDSPNQDLWVDGFPNPDMVLPDTDALLPDLSDQKRCLVYTWITHDEFARTYGKRAKITNLKEFSNLSNAGSYKNWVSAERVCVAEAWRIKTRERRLLLFTAPAAQAPERQIAPMQAMPPQEIPIFEDEIGAAREDGRLPMDAVFVRELRKVDYPEVWQYMTNGLEILNAHHWIGRYIPIVSCFGKVLFEDSPTGVERKILSMTRFGRDPWKAYCYACSQELEVLAMVPKAPMQAWAGQLRDYEKDWAEAPYTPKAYLLKHHLDENGVPYPANEGRMDYMQGQYLQGIEIVKEGFRRAIQSAMGSNFLPTQAQKRNEKSGRALDKMEQAATQGTYHFVYSYDAHIERIATICEDLLDKTHDYRGESTVIDAIGKASTVVINDPTNPKAVRTKGDYLGTIRTAPSSDSEREAVEDFTETLVQNLQTIAEIAGPKPAAAVMATSIRMRNLGPMGEKLADLIEPPEFKQQEGQEPPSPQMLALQAENQQMKGVLQQASQERQAKVVEQQGKFQIVQFQEAAEDRRAALDREKDLTVAELSAKIDRLTLFLEERARIGADRQMVADRVHEAMEAQQDRAHARGMAAVQQAGALEQAAQGQQHALEQTAQQAALAPPEAPAA